MRLVKKYLCLFIGVAIVAFGLYNIHSRTNITEGGVLGGILLLENWFGLSPSILNIVLDVSCYILGLYYLGKAFLFKALISTFAFSLFYRLFESIGPILPDLSSYPLIASLLGALFVGLGVGIVIRQGGAVGGDDALALVISKVFHFKISSAYLFTDITVLLLSLTYIPFMRIFYSLITVTISSYLIEKIQKWRPATVQGS